MEPQSGTPQSVTSLETFAYGMQDGVAQVSLNRPDQRNAINRRMGEETLAIAQAIAGDPSVRSVLITGRGPRVQRRG